ncbi:hypothetical protein E8E13_009866 [Curvularia kusanoi]|uniref:Uncharacterized protein n=1 Tax=Curvularia kusanoi TaxID=90978 RepID=A0A9P4W917_CURKU|nr:hypothetical protein E8E13_009866 [Curvularia kusanoi]
MANIRNLKIKWIERQGLNSDYIELAYKALVLEAIAESVASVMDDSSVASGSASLASGAYKVIDVAQQKFTVQIGSQSFIWAIKVVNLVGSIAVVVGHFALRKADIPTFKYCDVGCVAVDVHHGIAVMEQID